MCDDRPRSLDVVCEYWESRGECLYIHESERISEGWEDEYISTPVDLGEFFFVLGAEETYLWKSPLK
jgi:hypothetical protein